MFYIFIHIFQFLYHMINNFDDILALGTRKFGHTESDTFQAIFVIQYM